MAFSDAFRANWEALCCLSLMFPDCCAFSALEFFVSGGGSGCHGDGVCVSFIAGKHDGIISVPVSRRLFISDSLLICC